jgi:hypothetical protein
LFSHHRTFKNDYEYDNPSNDFFFLAQAQASWMHEESQHKYLRTNIEAQFSWCFFFSFWRSGSVMVDEKGTHSKHPPPLGTTFNVYYTCYNIVTGNVVIKNIPKV